MAMSIKEVEDYLTKNVSGVTTVDVSVEYPEEKETLYLEGEKDYFFFIGNDGKYRFTDGKKQVKIDSHEDPENPLTEEDMLDKMVKVILDEDKNGIY